jgi:tRNA A37 methylthiotransferase MiaB
MLLDVLLVNPNRMKPPIAPLALEVLATALEGAGLSCAICDLCFADDPGAALAADLEARQPRLVALTMRNSDDCYCVTQHSFIPDIQERVAQLRAHCDAPIVIGGAGYSTAPEAILELVGADYGIVGDGEEALAQLARAVRDGVDASAIPGLVWRDGEHLRRNAPAYPDFGQTALSRDHLDNRRYFAEGGQGGLETKRGCPMPCVYCADPLSKGRRLRLRPPAAIVQEARNLLAQGVDAIHLCDSEFNLPLEHAKAVCAALIEAGVSDRWRFWAYLSPTPFDAELADLLVRAGCQGVNFGADSGDAGMLRRLGRQYTPDDLCETGRLCRQHGLTFMFDLLLGGPGETRESLRRTIELMKTIEPDCVGVAFGLRLYAGTAAAELVRRQGFSPANPNLRGRTEANEDFAWPIFFVEAGLGAEVVEYLRELIAGDRRFFFGWPDATQADYNYDDNQALVAAIAGGARGAYWDILRRLTT